jgi:hypothetical protein
MAPNNAAGIPEPVGSGRFLVCLPCPVQDLEIIRPQVRGEQQKQRAAAAAVASGSRSSGSGSAAGVAAAAAMAIGSRRR